MKIENESKWRPPFDLALSKLTDRFVVFSMTYPFVMLFLSTGLFTSISSICVRPSILAECVFKSQHHVLYWKPRGYLTNLTDQSS